MRQRPLAVALGCVAIAGVLSCALNALGQPDWGNDYVGIWGLKAQAIERAGTLAAVFDVDPRGEFSHPEYPILWPLVLAAVRAASGDGRDLVPPLLFPFLCGAASLLAFRATRARPAARALAGALVALLPYYRVAHMSGYAEGLLVVWLLAALGEVDGLERSAAARLRFAFFLSAACATKQEGMLAAAVATAVLLLGRHFRTAAVVTSAVLLSFGPWLVVRAFHPSSHRDFALDAFDPSHVGVAIGVIGSEGVVPNALPLLCALGVFALAPQIARRRKGVLLAVALSVSALVAGFAFTVHPPRYHVAYSYARWSFVALACLVPILAEAVDDAAEKPDAA